MKSPLKVALVLIGNELLSGKIQDSNGHYASKRLRGLGVELTRISIIPDQRQVIVSEVSKLKAEVDYLITSGGVGPTHDDITLEAVADACSTTTFLEPRLEKLIRGFFKDRTTPHHLRMAQIPEGSVLIDVGENTWPVVRMDNIFILPGVPEIFRAKFEAIASTFRSGNWFLRSVYLNVEEGTVAPLLQTLETLFEVSVGSYPKWRNADHKVRVTIEGRASQPVNEATNHLISHTDPSQLVRVDDPVEAD
ncbi:MAG: competence/damage-inducible protein A [Myxococcota bacterium]|nr:competence/damage-inducible protein A [Myxococcota bacterium]